MKRTTPLPNVRSARLLRSRRFALVAAVAVFGLTACGDPSSTASPGTTASSGLPVIEITGGGSPISAAAGAAPSAEAGSADTKMMAAYVRYLYGGGSVPTSPATAWFFTPGVEPTQEQIAALAGAFGLDPVAVAVPADQGGGWRIGSESWEEPSLTIGGDATLGWWYNPGVTDVAPQIECGVIAVDPVPAGDAATTDSSVIGGDTISPCPEPTPPANVPDEATARANGIAWLQSLGLDPADYAIDVWADEWGANVTASLLLDGVKTPLTMSIGYGAEGATTWASGFLATPQRGGDYPLISGEEAVQRLNDQMTGWMTAARAEPAMGVAEGGGVMAGALANETQPVEGDDAPDATIAVEAPLDCTDPAVSCEAIPPADMEPIDITLRDATASLEMQWSDDGTVWLLPGYSFTADDGGIYNVIAIDDQYLVVQTVEATPLPAPVEPPTSDAPAEPATPDLPVDVNDERLQAVIGMTQADAEAKLAEIGLTLRVIELDGVPQPATMDLRPDRVNVAVTDGVVTSVQSLG
jgi:hypothetical protein